jgi:hypothetical protein
VTLQKLHFPWPKMVISLNLSEHPSDGILLKELIRKQPVLLKKHGLFWKVKSMNPISLQSAKNHSSKSLKKSINTG